MVSTLQFLLLRMLLCWKILSGPIVREIVHIQALAHHDKIHKSILQMQGGSLSLMRTDVT